MRTENARRKIIEATIQIMAEEGYRSATFARIQEIAGMSRGLVGYHFGSKVGLITEVVESLRNEYQQELAGVMATGGPTGFASIVTMVTKYLGGLRENPNPVKVMLILATESVSGEREVQKAIQNRYAEMRSEFALWVEKGIVDGSIDSGVDAVQMAWQLEAMLRGLSLQYLVEPGAVDLDRVIDGAAKTVTRSLAPRPAS